ncbi:hypothetical protein Bca4012_028067 [Brassica carinata]
MRLPLVQPRLWPEGPSTTVTFSPEQNKMDLQSLVRKIKLCSLPTSSFISAIYGDCLEAKAQNRALKRAQEADTLAQQSDASVNETRLERGKPINQAPAFQFSASNKNEMQARREAKDHRETHGGRAHKNQSREWQERGNSRRSSQAREQSRAAKERSFRDVRENSRQRYADIAYGRSYYREVGRIDNSQRSALSPSKTRERTSGRGVPLPGPQVAIPQEAFNEALGKVRDTMLQYTKSTDPVESGVRIERLRQAEEQGILEKSAARIVRNQQIQERGEVTTTPERTPVALRLGPTPPPEEDMFFTDQNDLPGNSKERIPATLRIGPITDDHRPSSEDHLAEQHASPTERLPASQRLGPILDSPRDAEHNLAPSTKRKPGRPPGSRRVEKVPKPIADVGTKIRRVSKVKPSPRRKEHHEVYCKELRRVHSPPQALRIDP